MDLVCPGGNNRDLRGGLDRESSSERIAVLVGARATGRATRLMRGNTLEAATKPDEPPGLIRGLGGWASAAIVAGTMIGTGIFLKPSEMAAEGGSVAIVFAAWIAGGFLSMFGALSFAELGAAIPEAGGEYAYLRRGFGPVWGFLFGWMHSIVGRPSSLASIAAGLLRFWSFLIPVVAAPLYTFHFPLPFSGKPYEFVFTWAQPVALG